MNRRWVEEKKFSFPTRFCVSLNQVWLDTSQTSLLWVRKGGVNTTTGSEILNAHWGHRTVHFKIVKNGQFYATFIFTTTNWNPHSIYRWGNWGPLSNKRMQSQSSSHTPILLTALAHLSKVSFRQKCLAHSRCSDPSNLKKTLRAGQIGDR